MSRKFNQLPTDGYLIFPISMSRATRGQSPKECITILNEFEKKIVVPGLDVAIIYTNGLYFNTAETAYKVRTKTNNQMMAHRNAMQKLVIKMKFMPQAFHYLPFDYVALNTDHFITFYDLLKKAYTEDKHFRKVVKETLAPRKPTQANINFLLEEIAFSHIIRQHLVDFPKTLVRKDTFRLIVYPGPPLKAEVYVWQKKILPSRNIKELGPYYAGYYNAAEKKVEHFDDIVL